MLNAILEEYIDPSDGVNIRIILTSRLESAHKNNRTWDFRLKTNIWYEIFIDMRQLVKYIKNEIKEIGIDYKTDLDTILRLRKRIKDLWLLIL